MVFDSLCICLSWMRLCAANKTYFIVLVTVLAFNFRHKRSWEQSLLTLASSDKLNDRGKWWCNACSAVKNPHLSTSYSSPLWFICFRLSRSCLYRDSWAEGKAETFASICCFKALGKCMRNKSRWKGTDFISILLLLSCHFFCFFFIDPWTNMRFPCYTYV